MPDQPQAYYDALPEELKNYNTIETRNRDQNYFLYMYLADIRAVDYLASRPDWDGKTLVVMGTSMGGQQSLCAAGLHPEGDARCWSTCPRARTPTARRTGARPAIRSGTRTIRRCCETAAYFDTVNCAARIKVPSLVSMGFIDTATPPVGIWAAFNQIKGPKEAAPMPESPHNHLATPEQSLPWTRRLGTTGSTPSSRAGRPSSRPTSRAAADRRQLDEGARAIAGEAQGRADRRVLHGRLHHAALGRDRRPVPGPPGQLARQLHGLERRQLRLGRRQDAEHAVAPARTASSMA